MNPILHHKDFFRHWQSIEPESIDLILTDPPYGLFGNEKGLNLKWDKKPDIPKMENIFNELLKPTGQVLMFCNLDLLINLLAGFTNHFQFRYYLLWIKNGMPISKMRPICNVEFISVWRRKGVLEKDLTWNPYELSPERGLPYSKKNYTNNIPTRKGKKSPVNENKDGWRYPKATLYASSRPNMTKEERSVTTHIFQKPLSLLRRLIKTFSNPGDIVLDNFAGSGSTLISAYKEGRKSIGYELQLTYYNEAKQRIDNLTAQEVLF